jgi:hypothetical protein
LRGWCDGGRPKASGSIRAVDLSRIEKRIAKLEREADNVRERMLVP